MKYSRAILLSIMLLSSGAAQASATIDALGQCILENTSGRDRKDFAQWMFVAMSAHPEMRKLAIVSSTDEEAVNRAAGAILTRLLAENCSRQFSASAKADGENGIKAAFELFGKVAMQELMTNPQVSSSFAKFEKYVDQAKIDKVLKSN